MKVWKKVSPLMLLVLIIVPTAIIGGAEDPQGIRVEIPEQGPIEVNVFGDLTLNITKVYDVDMFYLAIHNLFPQICEYFGLLI